jgi:hypothetical protein
MSVSLGGLGILSIRRPFAELATIFLGKGDIRSLFCLIVFLIVALVLAYLTNPSENSFRAYLTEQSFRHHLSRLDDHSDDLQPIHNSPYPRCLSKRSNLIAPSHFFIDSSPFYLANRASICLRTPKHVFHSFAIFTIAAMIPYSNPCDGENQDTWIISDAWYIGAFGKWWRGGALEAWYQDVIARSKGKDSWTSGIPIMKPLENTLSDHTAGFDAHFSRGSLPQPQIREQSALRQSIARPRSSTPPPLPKSVLLPLHAIQRPLTNARYSCDRLSKMKSSPPRPCIVNGPSRHGTCSTRSRSTATLLEHSPILDEVLRQITNGKECVLDIRTQIAECQSVTTRSHSVLQCEVETYRERKQQEDAARLELKSRTKLLDDSRRGAECIKKDAEKSLRTARLIRDNANHQLESLQEKILGLQNHLLEDRDLIYYYQKQSFEPTMNDTLEQKKADIQGAELSVAILNQRSRELEDRLSSERERLRILRQKSEDQKLCYPFLDDIDPVSQHYRRSHPLPSAINHGSSWDHLPFVMPGGRADLSAARISPVLLHPRNRDLYDSCGAAYAGHTEVNKTIPSEVHQDTLSDGNQETSSSEVVSTPFGSGLNAVSRDHTDDVSGSVGETDPGTERNWYGKLGFCNHRHLGGYPSLNSIPTFIPTSTDGDRSFEAHVHSYDSPGCARPAKFDAEHISSLPVDLPALYDIPGTSYCHATHILDQSQSTRSLALTPSLNINEFTLFDNPSFDLLSDSGNASADSTFDALNPNGLGSALMTPPSSTSQSFLRAFAPSPAEREALQRALSGSTNASLERLPSLSAVGSLPSSPTSSHMHDLPQHSHSLRDLRNLVPTWLKVFPSSGTVKFSPWEDEDLKKGDQFVTVLQAQT